MAKIDVTKIEGFEAMDSEAKLQALLNFDVETPQSDSTSENNEIKRLKAMLGNANSEAADYKKKWKATLSEQEQKAIEVAESIKAKDERIKELEAKETIATYKSSYLSMGYDDELATATAKAMAEGNMAEVFANQVKFNTAHKKAIEESFLNNQPQLSVGNTPKTENTISKAQFDAMTYTQRLELFNTDPDTYHALNN